MHPLKEAARLIEEYIATLNVGGRSCDCCEAFRYDDFQAYNDAVQLSAMVNRLHGKANPNRKKNQSRE